MFASAAMRGAIDDHARLQRMLDVEAALAQAEADVGIIPKSAVGQHNAHQLLEEASRKAIAEKCHLRDVLGADPRITAHLSVREIE
jgi:3-carboxy-cis,cis-muconate cycloisomerase